MKKIILFGTATLLLTTSCATIFTGTKDPITFNSEPAGAKVLMDNVELCVTPCTADVRRSLKDQQAVLQLAGYRDEPVALGQKFNAVTLLNILAGGIIGLGVDLGTGSLMKHKDKEVTVTMKPQ